MAVLTPQALKDQIDGELARRDLHEFIRQAWHVVEPATVFQDNWHIGAICEHLTAVTNGEIRNLLINIPPRTAKSTTVSVMWPMWVWTFRPEFRWLFASYRMDLSIRDSLQSRRLVDSPWYQRHWGDVFSFAPDQNLKSRFENTRRGYRYATSVGGGITGEGGDAIVVDDPHNVREQESDAKRDSVLEWWDQAMSTRLNDPKTGAKVIVMQRIHQDDLSGHVIEQGNYEHLNLPMEFEPSRRCVTSLGWSDPRTEEGDLLWPDRFGEKEIEALKLAMGPYGYAGQMQQRPTPKSGGTFKQEWLDKRYASLDSLPRMRCIIQSIDSAFKEGVANDYSVVATWGTDGVDYYLLGLWRGRVDFPGLVRTIKDQYAAWNGRLQGVPVSAILVEDKGAGTSAIQTVRKDTNLPVIGYKPEGSKESRADNVAPLFEAKKVLLPEFAEWLAGWIDEHVNFPRSAHDDQVDTTSQGLDYLKNKAGGSARLEEMAAARKAYGAATIPTPFTLTHPGSLLPGTVPSPE